MKKVLTEYLRCLGFETEALWDSQFEKVHGFKERKFLSGKSSPRRGKILLQFVEEWRVQRFLCTKGFGNSHPGLCGNAGSQRERTL
jgi:hypothetical protein